MAATRPKFYAVAIVGLALFAALVLLDTLRPGLLPGSLSLGVSLGLAFCGVAVIALRPRTKRVPPHEASQDFTAILEERRRLAERSAQRPPRRPPE